MHVTLLGTGSAFSSPNRVQSGTLIERGSDRLLVDCGSGILHRLGCYDEISETDIEHVLLTHLHLDHVSDLPGLFKARILRDEPHLAISGPPGTRQVCESLFSIDDLLDRGSVVIREFRPDNAPFSVGGFTIDAATGTHSLTSFAYRFGDALTLSGDTAVDSSVLALADGVHTLVHECSHPDGVRTETHTTPSALANELGAIDVQQIFLTHLFPETELVGEELIETIDPSTDAEVHVARDLTSFELPE